MSDPKIKYREYKGITVGDVNDIAKYINEMSSTPIGSYVVNIGKQGDLYSALLSNGQQITWTSGGSGTELTPEALEEVLEGSDTIVVDLNEEGDKLQVRLDADIIAQLGRTLLIPVSTITATELVGIGTDKEQKRVKIGSGLGYDTTTDTLYATGTGETVYWNSLPYSSSDDTLITEYLSANYFTQEEVNYKINILNTKIDNKVSDIIAGTNITVSKNPETHAYTISSTGGGTSTVYNIEIEINGQTGAVSVVSDSYKTEITNFFNTYKYFPPIKATISVVAGSSVVETFDVDKNDAKIVNNELQINFIINKLTSGTSGGNEIQQLYYVDNGTEQKTQYKSFSTEKFQKSLYFTAAEITEQFATAKSVEDLSEVVDTLSNTVYDLEHDLRYDYYTKDNITSILTSYLSVNQAEEYFQHKNDTALTTSSKNIVGAINEVNAKTGGYLHIVYVVVEIDNVNYVFNFFVKTISPTTFSGLSDIYSNWTNITNIRAYKQSDKTPIMVKEFQDNWSIKFVDLNNTEILWEQDYPIEVQGTFQDSITENWPL